MKGLNTQGAPTKKKENHPSDWKKGYSHKNRRRDGRKRGSLDWGFEQKSSARGRNVSGGELQGRQGDKIQTPARGIFPEREANRVKKAG